MSKTLIKPIPVSQSSNPDHQVKLACHVGDHVVVDCSCGASSPLCTTIGNAREWWRQHVGLPARGQRQDEETFSA